MCAQRLGNLCGFVVDDHHMRPCRGQRLRAPPADDWDFPEHRIGEVAYAPRRRRVSRAAGTAALPLHDQIVEIECNLGTRIGKELHIRMPLAEGRLPPPASIQGDAEIW